MKKKVTETNVNQEKIKKTINKNTRKAIGIFIVNNKGKILLRKNTDYPSKQHSRWEIPHLFHRNISLSPLSAAQKFLQQLKIDCDLYEAFTVNTTPTQKGGPVIIALTKQKLDLHFATNLYKWAPIDYVLLSAHEHSSHYAPQFCTELEGVALYLKNRLKIRL